MKTEKRKKRFGFYILFFLIFIGIFSLAKKITTHSTFVSPLPEHYTREKNVLGSVFSENKDPDTLKKLIRAIVKDTIPNYSVLVIDYESGFTMAINDQVMYTAASVNKIPILATLYYLAQKGEVDLDKNVTVQASDYQEGTGVSQIGKVYSIKTLAKMMMQQSDNTAAYILANHILGLERLQKTVTSWNLLQTNIEENTTSNYDMSILLDKIYRGNIANKAATKEMFAFMHDTDFEDRIPALLPKEAKAYHKIGTAIGSLHDVGIVDSPNATYYIGMFTSDITSEEETTKTMQQISKTVYTFLQ